MRVPSREREKNPFVIKEQGSLYRHMINVHRDLPDQALEGTGSLLFDVENRKIYCELSVRADFDLLNKFISDFNKISKAPYEGVVWHSFDPKGNAVYHTNVVMALLKDHAILCTDSISDKAERDRVVESLTNTKQKKPL